MKKKARKLILHRESIRILSSPSLEAVVGGSDVSPTICEGFTRCTAQASCIAGCGTNKNASDGGSCQTCGGTKCDIGANPGTGVPVGG